MATNEMKTLLEGKRWILENSSNEHLIETTKAEIFELLHTAPVKQCSIQGKEEEDFQVLSTVCGILMPMLIVPFAIYFNLL